MFQRHQPEQYGLQSILTPGNQQNPNFLYFKDRSRTPNQPRQYNNNDTMIPHRTSQSPQSKFSGLHTEIKMNSSSRSKGVNQWKDPGMLSRDGQQFLKLPQRTQDRQQSPSPSNHQELSLIHLDLKSIPAQISSNISNLSTNNYSNNSTQQIYAQMISLSSEKQKLIEEQRQYMQVIDNLQINNAQLLKIINSCQRCYPLHQVRIQQVQPIIQIDKLQQEFYRKNSVVSLKDSYTQDNFYHDVLNQLDHVNTQKSELISELQMSLKEAEDLVHQQTNENTHKIQTKLKSKEYNLNLYESQVINELLLFSEFVIKHSQKHLNENRHYKDHLNSSEVSLKLSGKNKDHHNKCELLPSTLKALQLVIN